MLWLQFIISAAVIVLAGIRLTTYADILSDRLNLGKVWIGVVLLGFVTSLPEAVASLTAVVSLQALDLAVGNMVGSNNFNLFLVVIMDMVYRSGAVTNGVAFSREHVAPAVFSLLLVGMVMSEILWLGPLQRGGLWALISVGSLAMMGIYFWGMNRLAVWGALGTESAPVPKQDGPQPSVRRISLELIMSAALVVVGAVSLANSSDRIADITGLGRTFVGTFFLALATSLPEMVVTISAVRLGALGLAIGNIFGSNMTNMVIVAFCDLAYGQGVLLNAVSRRHVVTAVLGVIMTGIVLAGMKRGAKRTVAGIGVDSWAVAVIFCLSMGVMYALR